MQNNQKFFDKVTGLLSDSYELISEIGYGGMGRVYKARDVQSGEFVAIKAIRPEHVYNETMLKRFEREMYITQKIKSDYVVKTRDYLIADELHFIVMNYLEGENLGQIIEKAGYLSTEDAADIALQILKGLQDAHKETIIHRDLKPQNIIVDKNGGVSITDFGLAREIEGTRLTAMASLMGTPQYIAPEQWLGEKVDIRTDVYSFGIMLYEMVYGLLPFQTSNEYGYMELHLREPIRFPRKVEGRKIPSYIRSIILRCLEKRPENRYQNTQQIIDDLSRRKASGTFSTKVRNRVQRTPKSFWYIAAMAIILTGVAIFTKAYIEEKTKPVPPKPTKPLTFAVLYFEDKTNDPELEFLSYGIPDLLTTDLQQSKYLYVLNHKNVYESLVGADSRLKYNYSKDILKRIAEIAGVNYLITGVINKTQNDLSVDLQVNDGESGEVLFNLSDKCGDLKAIYSLVDSLTYKIKRVGIRPQDLKNDNDRKIEYLQSKYIIATKHLIIGRQLLHRKKYNESIEHLDRALTIDPGYARCHYIKKSSLYMLKRVLESKHSFREAYENIERFSKFERRKISAIYVGFMKKKKIIACKMLEELIKDYPLNLELQVSLAAIHHDLREYNRAEQLFLKAKSYSNNVQIMMYLASIYQKTGEYDKLISIANEASSKYPNESWFIKNKFEYWIVQKQFNLPSKATKNLESIDRPAYFEYLAMSHHLKGELRKANELINRLGQVEKGSAFHRLRSAFLFNQGKYIEAKKNIEDSLNSIKSDTTKFYLMLDYAYIECKTNNIHKSIELYEKSLERYRKRKIFASFYEYMSYFISGYVTSFSDDFSKIKNKSLIDLANLSKKSDDTEILSRYNFLKHIFSNDCRQLEKLYANHDKEYAYYNKHALYLEQLYRIYMKKGMVDKALYTCERIQGLTFGRVLYGDVYALSFYHQGKIWQKQGKHEKSKKAYTQFLKLWGEGDRHIFKQIDDAENQLKKISSF